MRSVLKMVRILLVKTRASKEVRRSSVKKVRDSALFFSDRKFLRR